VVLWSLVVGTPLPPTPTHPKPCPLSSRHHPAWPAALHLHLQLFGNLVTVYLVDRVGRKKLQVVGERARQQQPEGQGGASGCLASALPGWAHSFSSQGTLAAGRGKLTRPCPAWGPSGYAPLPTSTVLFSIPLFHSLFALLALPAPLLACPAGGVGQLVMQIAATLITGIWFDESGIEGACTAVPGMCVAWHVPPGMHRHPTYCQNLCPVLPARLPARPVLSSWRCLTLSSHPPLLPDSDAWALTVVLCLFEVFFEISIATLSCECKCRPTGT